MGKHRMVVCQDKGRPRHTRSLLGADDARR
jgi:hypothetical protein